MSTSDITPGERRELRSVVKGQFSVLRAEVKRRRQEMEAEIETELLLRYRDQDDAIRAAEKEVAAAHADLGRQVDDIAERLRQARPEPTVRTSSAYGHPYTFVTGDDNRAQTRRALVAAIPNQVGDAELLLARREQDMLRELSAGTLQPRRSPWPQAIHDWLWHDNEAEHAHDWEEFERDAKGKRIILCVGCEAVYSGETSGPGKDEPS